MSAAVEAAANEPFFTFMRTQIFAPLGMTETMPDSATEPIPDRATFYFPRFSGDNPVGHEVARPVDYSCFAGAGAFLSTPSDLVRFGIAMGSGKLLQPDTVRMLQTPQPLASGKDTDYGLGWMLETFPLAGEPTRMASHASRSLLGASTSFMTFPERGHRRGRDVEYVVREHEADCAGNRGSVCEIEQTSIHRSIDPSIHLSKGTRKTIYLGTRASEATRARTNGAAICHSAFQGRRIARVSS